MNLAPYRKAVVAIAGVLAVLGKVLADGNVDVAEIGELAAAMAVAFGVYRVPNSPQPEVI